MVWGWGAERAHHFQIVVIGWGLENLTMKEDKTKLEEDGVWSMEGAIPFHSNWTKHISKSVQSVLMIMVTCVHRFATFDRRIGETNVLFSGFYISLK